MKQILSPIKIFGGGRYKCQKIASLIDWNDIYCEPFLGGANLLLNSPDYTTKGARIKKYAFDKNFLLINTWRFIQQQPKRLQKFLKNVDHSIENFNFACKYIKNHENNIEEENQYFMLACCFLIRNRFSRAADEKTFGYSPRLRRGMPEYTSSWLTMIDGLTSVSNKIKDVVFDCGDAINLIKDYGLDEKKECRLYADPPFCHESRSSKNNYQYEMKTYIKDDPAGETTHESMLNFFLNNISGKVYVSGYDSTLYNNKLSSMRKISWNMANSQSQARCKRVMNEQLWVIDNAI